MDCAGLREYVRAGEGISVEFKRCGGQPGEDVFETICAFANRQGGNVFLGVSDDGRILGVPEQALLGVQRNIVNMVSNPKMFNFAPVIEVEAVECDGKTVVRVWVPMGPVVYTFKGVAYDRMADADVKIVGVDQIALLYLRKQNTYSERRVYPFVTMDDMRGDLIDRARSMALARRPDHPWGALDDEALLRSAKLYARDRVSGAEGLTLAAVVLVGTDDVIGDVLPGYKTDAVVRRDDLDRYDDRIVVRTNLLDAYGALSEFARKHLPDRFVLDSGRRVSARDIIVRELVSNLLIHREFLSPYPAKLIIDPVSIRTENASRSLYEGRLMLSDFNPIPKNPVIAGFFSNIGYAEELGSGMRNLQKYSLLYSGIEPSLEDGDIFRARVATTVRAASGADGVEAAVVAVGGRGDPVTASDVARLAGVSLRTAQRRIKKMLEAGELVPDESEPHVYRRP